MSGAARKMKRARSRSGLMRGKVGARQGTRLFASTGHVMRRKVADNLTNILSATDSHTNLTDATEDIIFCDMFRRHYTSEKLNMFARSKLGREMLGVPFKSKMEANVSRYFEALRTGRISTDFDVVNWIYEPCRFWFPIARGVTNYSPDFLLVLRGRPIMFVEVKGYLDKRSKTALTRFERYYPQFELKLFDAASYRAIESKLAQVIDGWE